MKNETGQSDLLWIIVVILVVLVFLKVFAVI